MGPTQSPGSRSSAGRSTAWAMGRRAGAMRWWGPQVSWAIMFDRFVSNTVFGCSEAKWYVSRYPSRVTFQLGLVSSRVA